MPTDKNLSRRDVLKTAASAAAVGAALPLTVACTQAGRAGTRPAAVLPPAPAGIAIPAAALGVLRSGERGSANHGWLDTKHSFSFASYYDPERMGFRGLRVINEDVIAPGEGFPMHPHRDMEIVTYVLSGSLEHRDTLGNGGVIVPGEIQRMTAGRGIRHSEYNPSRSQGVHLLQIWIEPSRQSTEPGYAQKTFSAEDRSNRLRLVASPAGADGSISFGADAGLRAGILEPGRTVATDNAPGRHAWLQVARGAVDVNGVALRQGDAIYTSTPGRLEVKAGAQGAEVLLFDLA
jgi:quercetin 2,3-dioxygenase